MWLGMPQDPSGQMSNGGALTGGSLAELLVSLGEGGGEQVVGGAVKVVPTAVVAARGTGVGVTEASWTSWRAAPNRRASVA
jgi:hypothetical protein